MKDTKKQKIIIVVLMTVVLMLVGFIYYFSMRANGKSEYIPESVEVPSVDLEYISIKDIPARDLNGDSGIDTNSEIVILSTRAVEILSTYLPYEKHLESSDGIPIEIIIPTQEFVSNEWTLLVQIFGPDYQVSAKDPRYDLEKRAFQLAAQNVFAFLKSHNIPSKNIILQWGDRKIIQDRSEQWLAE